MPFHVIVLNATVTVTNPVQTSVKSVVFLGTFGPPSLTFARSCASMGISVHLLIAGGPDNIRRFFSCFASIECIDPAIIGTLRGIESVASYCRRVGAQALATLSESHCLWLAKNRTTIEAVCKLLVPPVACLERLASKVKQIAIAREAGLVILPTHVIHGHADVAAIEANLYPLCLRPSTNNASNPPFKVAMAHSPHELLQKIQGLHINQDGLIAQPFRALPNMVVHCASREGGELMTATAFLADRKFEGLALRVRPMPLPSTLVDKIRKFSSLANLCGAYHFDFLYSPETGEAYYLEVNPRFGGTTDKVIWFGVNEPADCLSAFGFMPSHPARRFATGSTAVVNKRATLKHLLATLRRRPEPWDFPQCSRAKAIFQSLSDLLLAKDSMCDIHDLRGTLAFHSQGLIS